MKKQQGYVRKVNTYYFIAAFILLVAVCFIMIFLPPNKSVYDENSAAEAESDMEHVENKEKNGATTEEELWMQEQIKKIDEMEKTMKESISRKSQSSNTDKYINDLDQ